MTTKDRILFRTSLLIAALLLSGIAVLPANAKDKSRFQFRVIDKFERGTSVIKKGMTKQEVARQLPKKIQPNNGYDREVLRVPQKTIYEKNVWTLTYGTSQAIGTTGEVRITFIDGKVAKIEDRYLAIP